MDGGSSASAASAYRLNNRAARMLAFNMKVESRPEIFHAAKSFTDTPNKTAATRTAAMARDLVIRCFIFLALIFPQNCSSRSGHTSNRNRKNPFSFQQTGFQRQAFRSLRAWKHSLGLLFSQSSFSTCKDEPQAEKVAYIPLRFGKQTPQPASRTRFVILTDPCAGFSCLLWSACSWSAAAAAGRTGTRHLRNAKALKTLSRRRWPPLCSE